MKDLVEYLMLVICATCGLGAVSSLIVLPVGVAGLLFSSWPKYLALWDKAREVDQLGAVTKTMALSAFYTFVAVAAAYGLGLTMRMAVVVAA